MVFSSATFLFYFLPVVLTLIGFGYLALKPFTSARTRTAFVNALLLLSSIVFYYWGEEERVWVLLTSVLLTYLCGLLIDWGINRSSARASRVGLGLGLLANGGFLLWFKYSYFGYETLAPILYSLGASEGFALAQVALPLGISFYTFQSISYLLDVYWRKTAATTNLLNFACYITFFPQLVAGPIVRFSDVRQDIRQRRIGIDSVADGSSRFVIGLSKKVLIANPVGRLADELFAMSPAELSTGGCWLACIAYGVQILFDFSGYSDMAIGLAKLLGIEIPENFRSPYKRDSVRSFWRNWHISLSSWFRDYVYIPLGGSRKSSFRTILNLNLVFLACGLWHGASWNFAAWGLYHGAFLAAEHFLATRVSLRRVSAPVFLKRLYTLFVVMSGWVLFRADSVDAALGFYRYMMIDINSLAKTSLPLSFYSMETQIALLLGLVLSTTNLPKRFAAQLSLERPVFLAGQRVWLIALFALSAAYVAISSYNPFIYFRF